MKKFSLYLMNMFQLQILPETRKKPMNGKLGFIQSLAFFIALFRHLTGV